MKRRDFFKVVTGFVAGVCTAFVPKAKAKEWTYVVADYNGKGNSDGIEIYPKRVKAEDKLLYGRNEIVDEFLLNSETQHLIFTEKENYLVINSNGNTRVIYLDGNRIE